MPRLARPLDQEADDSADEELYAAHYEDPRPNALYDAAGNRRKLSGDDPAQEGLRREWIELYIAFGGRYEGDEPDPSDYDDPVGPCGHDDHAVLRARVVEKWSGDPIAGARVVARGPLNGDRTSGDDGLADFGEVPSGSYDLRAGLRDHHGAPGYGDADVPAAGEVETLLILEPVDVEPIEVRLHDRYGVPLDAAPFEASGGGTIERMETDGQGLLRIWGRGLRAIRLAWSGPERYAGDPPDPYYTLDVALAPAPLDTEQGVRDRLGNLGYPLDRPLDGVLRAFQAHFGLDLTGEIDDAVRAVLAAIDADAFDETAVDPEDAAPPDDDSERT